MKLRAALLLGDRSPYGYAHLLPAAHHFDLCAVVLPHDARWRAFEQQLDPPPPPRWHELPTQLLRAAVRRAKSLRRAARIRALGVPRLVTKDANAPGLHARLRELAPQVLLSAAFPQKFGKALLEVAPRGAINFHPSLLPRFRGAHPHYWAIATGERRTGITAHFMTERLDDGPIVAQREIPIDGAYYAELYARLVAATDVVVGDVADFLSDRARQPRPQDPAAATFFRQDRDEHHRLTWDAMPAPAIVNRVRAGHAYCMFRGRRLVIQRAGVADLSEAATASAGQPGTIVCIEGRGLGVVAADGQRVVIEELGEARPQPFHAWARRAQPRVGERLD